jgi:hypothetical protein
LQRDPPSRRAIAVIAEPGDGTQNTLDQPCALGLQYLIRHDRLEAITYMRSQSAAMVLPYDAFLFMAIQCWLSSLLDLEPGPYHHMSGSIHIYEDETEIAEALANSQPRSAEIEPMPNPEGELDDLISWERELRTAVSKHDLQTVHTLIDEQASIGSFWDQARAVLGHDACTHLDCGIQLDGPRKRMLGALRELVEVADTALG